MKHKKLIAFLSGIMVLILVVLSIVSDAAGDPTKVITQEENISDLGEVQSPPLGGGGSSCDEYKWVKQWGRGLPWLKGNLRHPFGIHVDNSDNVYVADSGNYRVQKFTSNGDYLLKWGVKGTGNGQFNFPIGVATNPSGEFVYVLDFTNNNVQKFDSSGNFKLAWGGPGSLDGQFLGPRGITVDEFGNVFVLDTWNRRIQKFDTNGKWLKTWGSKALPEEFRLPTGIDTDIPGYIYVTDSTSKMLKKFDPASYTIIDSWLLPASDPRDLGIEDSGDIFVTDVGLDRVWKLLPDGSTVVWFGGPGSGNGKLNDPRGVDIDSKGNVYVADEGNSLVQKFSSGCSKIVIRKEFVRDPQQDVDFEFTRNFGGNFYLNANDLEGYMENEIIFPVKPNSPGTFYTVTEILRGYRLYQINCIDPSGGTTVDVANKTASISVSGGETVTCTFLNQLID